MLRLSVVEVKPSFPRSIRCSRRRFTLATRRSLFSFQVKIARLCEFLIPLRTFIGILFTRYEAHTHIFCAIYIYLRRVINLVGRFAYRAYT